MKFYILSALAAVALVALPVSFGETVRGGRSLGLVSESEPSQDIDSSDSVIEDPEESLDSVSASTDEDKSSIKCGGRSLGLVSESEPSQDIDSSDSLSEDCEESVDSVSASADEDKSSDESSSSSSDDGNPNKVAGVIGQSNPPLDYSIPPTAEWTDENKNTASALLDNITNWIENQTSVEGQLLIGAVTSVCNYNLVPPQWTYENSEGDDVVRCSFWKDYGPGGKPIRGFFEDWLYYTPIPAPTPKIDGGLNADEGFSNKTYFLPISNPGYYIERYDFIANTLNGRTLNFATQTFQDWMVKFLDLHGAWLSTPGSVAPYTRDQLNPDFPDVDLTAADLWGNYKSKAPHPYDIANYIVPKGGFTDYTSIFLRNIPKDLRPVTCDGTCNKDKTKNNNYISSPCDAGVAMLSYGAVLGTKGPWTDKENYGKGGVNTDEELYGSGIKSIYDIPGKLGDTFGIVESFKGYGNAFLGGPVIDLLLWFTDFHHFFAPVTGTVVYSNNFMGSHQYDFDNFNPNLPFAPKPVGSSNQVEWYANMDKHRRYALVFKANSTDIGTVGMAPVGFWGVGSMKVYSEVGDVVQRGDYVGHFLYGGSSILLTFEPGKNFNWVEPQPKNKDGGDKKGPPLMINNIQFPHQVNARAAIGQAIKLSKDEQLGY